MRLLEPAVIEEILEKGGAENDIRKKSVSESEHGMDMFHVSTALLFQKFLNKSEPTPNDLMIRIDA